MQPFVLNDETQVNSYGFRIPNKGIDLTRFKDNPVMLDDHNNSTSGVIGKWVNLRVVGSKLLADPDFDLHKDKAKEIAGQVGRGYLKGASMGVSFDRNNMQTALDGVPELSKCEKYESSICAIPSNANSVRLYIAATRELMSEAMVKLSLQGLSMYGSGLSNQNIITIDQFQAMPLAEQIAFKTDHNEAYLKMFGYNKFGMRIKSHNT